MSRNFVKYAPSRKTLEMKAVCFNKLRILCHVNLSRCAVPFERAPLQHYEKRDLYLVGNFQNYSLDNFRVDRNIKFQANSLLRFGNIINHIIQHNGDVLS
jgi:hypothetical protein